MLVYQALAEAFAQEETEVSFTLMGDGNMHFATELGQRPGIRTITVRHEHAAVAMATAHARARDGVGVASVTCGPGVTQISTALVTAVHARIPLVILAGESPIDKSWYLQRIDQGPVVTATGAAYISAHSVVRMQDYVRDAFYMARTERRPVVIGVPYDLQSLPWESEEPYLPSTQFMLKLHPPVPHPAAIDAAVAEIAAARRIILIGGLGARDAGCVAAAT
jgi:acetolactate synthase I/II/III large subunit